MTQDIYEVDEFDVLLQSQTADILAHRLPAIDNNGAVALNLAARGFVVFPILQRSCGDWSPIMGWQAKATADPETVREWWTLHPGARVGLLAGAANGVSVLDLDTKNGKDGIRSLAALGFADLVALSPVRVRTPSGGWHLYFRYEPLLKNSAGKIGVGIDVKTAGGYVIAPGSYKDGKCYRVEGAPLGSIALPSFPTALIPATEPQHDPVEVLTEPTDVLRDWAARKVADRAAEVAQAEDGTRNSTLNNAAMYVGGLAAHGLVTEDEARAALWAAASLVGIKTREFRGTFRSGWKAGLRKPVSLGTATNAAEFDDLDGGDDFDSLMMVSRTLSADDDWDGGDVVDMPTSLIKTMNEKHALVIVSGKSLVATMADNGAPDLWQIRTFHDLYANKRIEVTEQVTNRRKLIQHSHAWMNHPDRRTYAGGIVFAPAGASDQQFNLWRGWAVKPNPEAECQLFLHHLANVICCGQQELYAYLLGWMAHLVQDTADKPGVAIVLRGLKGTGKDVVGRYLSKMIGSCHVANIAQPDHLLGKFNGHLQSAVLAHVEEALWAGSKQGESSLKNLITAPTLAIERKGVDTYQASSCLRVLMSSNEDWTVPASADERRFAVFDVSAHRRGDAKYFHELHREMEDGGASALLHFLQAYDLSGFNVRAAPESSGLAGQKIASLRGVALWWLEVLQEGKLPGCLDDSWDTCPQPVPREHIRQTFNEWSRKQRYGTDVASVQFGQQMRFYVSTIGEDQPRVGGGRVRRYILPPLDECRKLFERAIGACVPWDT
jgi:hypothetical protein